MKLLQNTAPGNGTEDERAMEERLRITYEHAPIGIVHADHLGRFTAVNERFCQITGFPAEELVGRHFTEISHPDDVAMSSGRWNALMSGTAGEARYDRRYLRKDGRVACVTVNLAITRPDPQGPKCVIGLIEDITDRRAAEDRIRFQARLLDFIDQAVVAVDREERITFWNGAAERMFGWTEIEVSGRSWHDVVTVVGQWDREAVRQTMRSKETWHAQLEFLLRDGRIMTGACAVAPVQDIGGAVIGSVAAVTDVTARRNAENALRDREAQLSYAQEIARIGSWEFHYDSGATTCSAEMFRLYGLEPREVPSLAAFLRRVHRDDRRSVIAHFRNALVARRPFQIVHRIVVNGAERVISAGCRVVDRWRDFPESLVGVAQDITDQYRREQEISSAARQQEATAELGRLALSGIEGRQLFATAGTLIREVLQACCCALYTADAVLTGASRRAACAERNDCMAACSDRAQAALSLGDTVEHDLGESSICSARSAVSVNITGTDSQPLGVITVYSRELRRFTESDVIFIEAIANILGQAITRENGERELHRRAVQQEAIAELGRRTLGGVVQGTLDRVCELVKTGLGVPHALFLELDEPRSAIQYRAGRRWMTGPPQPIPVTSSSHAAQALVLAQPLAVDDYHACRMYGADKFFLPYGIKSGLCVPVIGRTRPYGVLTAQTVEERRFSPADIDFMRSMTSVLADAMDIEAAQRERDQLMRNLQLILESTVEGLYTVDMEGRVTLVNRAMCAILGISAGEIEGRDMHEVLAHCGADGAPLPPEACPVRGVLQSGMAQTSSDAWLRTRDGKVVPIEFAAAPIVDRGAVQGVVVTFSDITQRRGLESRLDQVNRVSSLGRLAAVVAHEFNNVLMGISTFVEKLHRDRSDGSVETSLEHISRSVHRGKRVTQDILRFAQPGNLALAPLDLEVLLDAVAAESRSILGSRYALTVDSAPLTIAGDVNQLHQIFMNLVFNARDAMPGGGSMFIRVARDGPATTYPFATIESPHRFAHIEVRDTGCGINAEIQRRIFEPLFTTKQNGTGLGLAIVRSAVTAHGGEIFVESAPGAGTTFHVFLPLVESHEIQKDPQCESVPAVPCRRLLLVEDDLSVAAGIVGLLEMHGLDVSTASTAAEVLPAIERERPDAVVLDVGLPDGDGIAVYRSIAAIHPNLPVVFSTGHGDLARVGGLSDRPNVAFLMKPYDIQALLSVLQRLIASPDQRERAGTSAPLQ